MFKLRLEWEEPHIGAPTVINSRHSSASYRVVSLPTGSRTRKASSRCRRSIKYTRLQDCQSGLEGFDVMFMGWKKISMLRCGTSGGVIEHPVSSGKLPSTEPVEAISNHLTSRVWHVMDS
ncbi:hypothetical protein PV11_00050 [Exophiala sideris]|uniref:Uncharacterized protein n=1 Tax=Exophiala sideris TaxID=1016849 RepID=A0A0D1W6E8_9EURO|nr:hypothetical protein PV11_00050 [Exophiala sideris]